MKDQFVLVYWVDAALHGMEQLSRKQADKDCNLIKIISGGILVNETKESITLALDWMHQFDEFRVMNTYPKTGIYKIVRYKFGKKKSAKHIKEHKPK